MECGWAGPVAPGFKLSTPFFSSCRHAEHGEHVKETADPTSPGCYRWLSVATATVCLRLGRGRTLQSRSHRAKSGGLAEDFARSAQGGRALADATCVPHLTQRSRTRLAQQPDALLLMAHRDKHQGLGEENEMRWHTGVAGRARHEQTSWCCKGGSAARNAMCRRWRGATRLLTVDHQLLMDFGRRRLVSRSVLWLCVSSHNRWRDAL
jgi:hypothetical protein